MDKKKPPSTDALLKIGQIAVQVGLAASALRFYEREGLVRPAARSRAGYRLYEPAAVEHLRFIRAGQAIGFSLVDIKALLVLDENTSCGEVQTMIETRLAEVDARLDNLLRVKTTLSDALAQCRSSNRGCAVMAELKGKSRKPRESG